MANIYLCVFEARIDRNELTKFLDTRPDEIRFWFWNLPNSIFIRSTLSAEGLSKLLETRFGQFTHIVVHPGTSYGRLPKDHWQYLK